MQANALIQEESLAPERARPSMQDALVVAAALEAGGAPLFSEALQDGHLTIRNPFATA